MSRSGDAKLLPPDALISAQTIATAKGLSKKGGALAIGEDIQT